MTAAPTVRGRVDPFEIRAGEDRCCHDMLIFDGRPTCGVCLGLPDLPHGVFVNDDQDVDLDRVAVVFDDDAAPTRCAFHSERYGIAAFCTSPRRPGSWLCDEHDDARIAGEL